MFVAVTVTSRLIMWDFVVSFIWVWSGVLIKKFINGVLGMGHEPNGEIIKSTLSVINMFVFAYLEKITSGGSYNPLTVFPFAISGDFSLFLLTVGARIPAQVIGSVTGVRFIIETFHEVGLGPHLNVDIHRGALTEGLLAFALVMIYLGLARNDPESFLMTTWIASISRLALHILGSDLTGGCMNPASAMGWAYARGDHITKEHILVYWLAPAEATLLAVWTFKLLVRPQIDVNKQNLKGKSD